MLELFVPAAELFDNSTSEFLYTKDTVLRMEHSLVSLSKWESKWLKPFLSTKDLTAEQRQDYFRCMTLTQNVDPLVYVGMSAEKQNEIFSYINATMTATTVNKKNRKSSSKIITAEVIYSWMIELGIPFECQKWHLNRLLMLIDVCSLNKEGPQKMSQAEIARQNREINQMRRQKYHTRG